MMIEVVAGLISMGNRILVCQRSSMGAFPLKWEFPGGKVEQGESRTDALRRELKEELNICVTAAHEVFGHRHTYDGNYSVELTFFFVDSYRGSPKNRVFERMAWVAIDELAKLDFLEGDRPILQRLRQRNWTKEK